MKRRRRKLKARLILRDGNKVLLLRQITKNREKHTLPGGSVDDLETVKEALIRECKEEIGITLKESNLEIIHILHKIKPNEDRVSFYFQASKWKGDVECLEVDNFVGVEWANIDDLPSLTSGTVVHVLQEIKKEKQYSHFHIGKKAKYRKARMKIEQNKSVSEFKEPFVQLASSFKN